MIDLRLGQSLSAGKLKFDAFVILTFEFDSYVRRLSKKL